MPQNAEHGGHHEVPGGEAPLQIIAIAEPGGKFRQGCLSACSASGDDASPTPVRNTSGILGAIKDSSLSLEFLRVTA
jgi:hypothetical protein